MNLAWPYQHWDRTTFSHGKAPILLSVVPSTEQLQEYSNESLHSPLVESY